MEHFGVEMKLYEVEMERCEAEMGLFDCEKPGFAVRVARLGFRSQRWKMNHQVLPAWQLPSPQDWT